MPLLTAATPSVAVASTSSRIVAVSAAGLAPLSPAVVRHLSQHPTVPVIVVLKDQHAAVPDSPALAHARAALVGVDQEPILADLHLTHAQSVKPLSLINAVSAHVSAGEEARLAADPAVAHVYPDVSWNLGTAPATTSTASLAGQGGGGALKAPSGQQICPAPGKVQLNPEALQVIHADGGPSGTPTAASLGYTGKGVTVAYIAEGIDIHNPDFMRDGRTIFSDYQDFTGDGTNAPTTGGEAFLDASSIAAQGNTVYDLSQGGNPVPAGCDIKIVGVAPGADLVGLKVFPDSNQATTSSIAEAIDYGVGVDHVNVLNESFGYNPVPDTANDLIRQLDEAAVAAGTTVVSSAGDAASNGSQGSPSTDPAVISAGATTTFRAYAQADIGAYDELGATGWVNDNISALSSGGSTEAATVPDLVAPGDLNWVVCTPDPALYQDCPSNLGTEVSGGTSEAAPLTSGTAALVIQAYRATHSGASPTPALIKEILVSTADDLGHPGYEQGAGLLDSYRAVEAALSVAAPGAGSTASAHPATGNTLLHTSTVLSATAPPSTIEHFPVSLTNTGQSAQTVSLSGRILGPPTEVSSVIVHRTTLVTFTVPPGVSRLDASVANPTAQIVLLDPTKELEAYSLPQGDSTGFGHVDVRYPGFGTWTALVAGTGTMKFSASVSTYQPFGTLTPSSVSLAPGASATVDVAAATPATPGDLSAAVVLTTPFGAATSIPIDLRSLVPFATGHGTFSTAITGGNGRGGAPAEVRTFQFQVPAGDPELTVQTKLTAKAEDDYTLFLVGPDGLATAEASDQLPGSTALGAGAQVHSLDPAAGLWTLDVVVTNPVGGTTLSAPLTGTVSAAPAPVTATGLPDSSSSVLPAGTATTVKVTVTDRGSAPEAFFVDGRKSAVGTVTLTPYTNATGVVLPLQASPATPQWIVPTDTTGLAAAASATAPVTFDWAPYLGTLGGEVGSDPDLGGSSAGDSASGTFTAPTVTPGDWFIDPALVGPFGASKAPRATADLTLSATTRLFDPSITSSTGDLWLTATGSTAPVRPVMVAPGGSATILVTITPSARAGDRVSGDLFVDDTTTIAPYSTPVGPTGDQVAELPFTYTVG